MIGFIKTKHQMGYKTNISDAFLTPNPLQNFFNFPTLNLYYPSVYKSEPIFKERFLPPE